MEQVLHYAEGQRFTEHHDYFDPATDPPENYEKGGNRLLTVIMYLSVCVKTLTCVLGARPWGRVALTARRLRRRLKREARPSSKRSTGRLLLKKARRSCFTTSSLDVMV